MAGLSTKEFQEAKFRTDESPVSENRNEQNEVSE